MKLTKLSMSLLVTGALAQIASEDNYEDHCSDTADGTKHEIHPGYFVEYYCDTLGPFSGDRVREVASAEACAKLCQDRTGCTGSSWAVKFNTCYLGTGEGDSASKDRPWTLYMKNVTPPPIPEIPEETGQSGASVCQRLHDQCLQEMQSSSCSCSGNPGNGGNTGGGSENGNPGNGGVVATGGNPDKKCEFLPFFHRLSDVLSISHVHLP